jgi:hypothetical protein
MISYIRIYIQGKKRRMRLLDWVLYHVFGICEPDLKIGR